MWHIPSFYDAAQGPTAIHDAEHLVFLGSALLFWWPIVHPAPGRRSLSYGGAMFCLLLAVLEGSLIGALLAFADQPVYETYRAAPRIWGISALRDQQLGGLLMWLAGGMIYVVAALVLSHQMIARNDLAEASALAWTIAEPLERGRSEDAVRVGGASDENAG